MFLPCDLNEGITTSYFLAVLWLTATSFYLVTWMKGLRPSWPPFSELYALGFYLVTWMKGLRRNLITLITVLFSFRFYLVTWMKGLRLTGRPIHSVRQCNRFLPCDLNEGITTQFVSQGMQAFDLCFYLVTWMKGLRRKVSLLLFAMQLVFTLWPEWRDYDLRRRAGSWSFYQLRFYLVTWMKGLRRMDITGRS